MAHGRFGTRLAGAANIIYSLCSTILAVGKRAGRLHLEMEALSFGKDVLLQWCVIGARTAWRCLYPMAAPAACLCLLFCCWCSCVLCPHSFFVSLIAHCSSRTAFGGDVYEIVRMLFCKDDLVCNVSAGCSVAQHGVFCCG